MPRFGSVLRGAFVLAFLGASLAMYAQSGSTGVLNGRGDENNQAVQNSSFMRGRTVPGRSSAELLQKALRQKAALRQNTLSHAALKPRSTTIRPNVKSGLKWTSLGPAPMTDPVYGYVAGRATAVAVDPNDASGNTVYVGGTFGGLWRSTNAAAQSPADVVWRQLLDSAASLNVGSVAVKPDDAKVILVGTGNADLSSDAYYGLGILRSEDGGATWSQITDAAPSSGSNRLSFKGAAINKIAFSTQTPTLVVATASIANRTQGLSASFGLYYSTDAGKTWTASVLKDGSTTLNGGLVGPSSVVFNPADKKFYASTAYHGIYTSSDGITFTRLANQPLGDAMATTVCPSAGDLSCPIYRGELAVRPGTDASKSEVYVWIINWDSTDRGIFVTRDGGATWTALDEAGINACGDANGCGTNPSLYNLALAAVPNGDSTDVYAGAANVFKCTVNAQNPTCSAAPFVNLTHAYGCTSAGVSHVHPAQHGIAFLNGTTPLFFVNDGGVYRANGADLSSGDCSVSNAFANLNGTIGSMAQLVSFSQTATDPNILLAGTATNGTASTNPTVDKGASGTGWDVYAQGSGSYNNGGYTAINPDDPNEWFVSSQPGSNQTNTVISRCASGANCKGQFTPVIDSSTYGNDPTASPMPYILDPNNSSSIILGTCRVWRGPSSGGVWTSALGPNFTTGDSTTCKASDRLVTAVAAGGPKTDGIGSQVIYAGDQNGRVYVTSNANDANPTWTEVTQSVGVNPVWGRFPISSIAIDSSDTTGGTAYITISGFNGVGHVYKTTGMGGSWAKISGDPANGGIPDAPANSIAIDPTNKQVLYVGTDVGVFMTSNGGTAWQEYGPTTGGVLPNSPVTKVEAISYKDGSGNTVGKLRASTYGRGVWETDLAGLSDFQIVMNPANGVITTGISGTATLRLTFNTVGPFSSDIAVTCSDLPSDITCTPAPATVDSTTNTSVITLVTTTSTTAGSHPFTLTATGGGITHSVSATLNVSDYTMVLGNPNSPDSSLSTQTVKAGSTAIFPIALYTTSGHTMTVSLSCTSTLPSGATCTFTPPSLVPLNNQTGASPIQYVTSQLTINTTAPTTAMLNAPHFGQQGSPLFALWMGLPGIVVAGAGFGGRKKRAVMFLLLALLVFAALIGVTACGGGSGSSSSTSSGTPAGTYTVTVTATSGTATKTMDLTLVVQ